MRKQRHLVAMYQSSSWALIQSSQHLAHLFLLSQHRQYFGHFPFPRFSKAQALPSGTLSFKPPPLLIYISQASHAKLSTGIRNHLPQVPSPRWLMSFECFLIQVFSRITLLLMISGLLPIDVFYQRNFLLSFEFSGYAFHSGMLIKHLLFLSYWQIKGIFVAFEIILGITQDSSVNKHGDYSC